MDHLSFDLRAPRARPRFKISRRNEFLTISGNRGAAKANDLLPTPRPISTTYQHSLSMTQPSVSSRTARAATERPNQQICRVADHQARPVPELPWGEPGLDCGRFLRLDMPQNRHEEPFPAHMAMKWESLVSLVVRGPPQLPPQGHPQSRMADERRLFRLRRPAQKPRFISLVALEKGRTKVRRQFESQVRACAA